MARRFRNTTGPAIRAAREAAGLTQEALAARLQIAGLDFDRVTVAKIEGQIRSLYDFEFLLVAAALKVGVADLAPSKAALSRELPALVSGELEV